MTDEWIDALIRRLDVPSDPDPSFVRATYAAIRPVARAARVSDASRMGHMWRDMSTFVLRPALLKGLVAATVIGVIAVGAALFVTRPDQPAVVGPSPTPTATFSPSAPASPSAGPSAAVVSPRAPTWTATGKMITPRDGHMAMLLLDGRVLVVGGPIEKISPANSAELYFPGTGTWASSGRMLAPRWDYTATLLADGRVLVAGGNNDTGELASAELYDPIGGTWSATGAMVMPRWGHTATLLSDGKVLVAGGITGRAGVASADVYDPVSGTWTATGAMATNREGHTATLLPDGKVLVAGGRQDGASRGSPSSELYDPISGTWTPTGNMITPSPRFGHTATLLPDGKVLVAGGTIGGFDPLASAELYDSQSGAWSATEGMVSPRSSHSATLLSDGRVLLAGGRGSADASASGLHEPLASAELFDPASGTWSATAGMVAVRLGHTATLLPDGRVLVASGTGLGTGGSVLLASAELYDPGSGN